MDQTTLTKNHLTKKTALITDLLMQNKVSAIILSGPESRFWFSGFPSTAGYVVCHHHKSQLDTYLIIDGRYKNKALTSSLPAVKHIIANQTPLLDLKLLLNQLEVKTCLFEQDYLTYGEYENLQKLLVKTVKLVPASTNNLRLVKSPDEISQIQAAAKITAQAFHDVCEFIRPGVSEKIIANFINQKLFYYGATNLSFTTIVASGPNSANPHANPTERLVETNDVILMDFGAMLNGYYSDMTRTVFIGEGIKELLNVYDVVLAAQTLGIKAAVHNQTAAGVDAVARAHIIQNGYEEYLMHPTGHGLGLEIHEAPRVSVYDQTVLTDQMVITVEPGIYLPNIGGVRIEDDICINGNQPIMVTDCPKPKFLSNKK